MNRLGIQSLNAGAPDLRLTGDQTQRGTYTQRRRNQMAYGGIAGLDGRKAYGIGSWFQKAKDKVVDDIIPNEIKENPLATAALIGGGINQFGIPGMDQAGQGWINDLLGGAGNMLSTGARNVGTTLGIPGADQWFTGGIMPTGSGMDYGIDDANLDPNWKEGLTNSVLNTIKTQGIGAISQAARNQLNSLGIQIPGLTTQTTGGTTGTGQNINWKTPLAIGTTVGALDYATRSDDKMPPQLSVNIPQSGQEAFDDPNLRFKPKEQYVDTAAMAADGGRIGYDNGGSTMMASAVGDESDEIAMELFGKPVKELNPSELEDLNIYLDNLQKKFMAQGGRIGYEDGKGVKMASYGYDDAMGESWEEYKRLQKKGVIPIEMEFEEFLDIQQEGGFMEMAQGGRIGYREGQGVESIPTDQMQSIQGQTAEFKPVTIEELLKPVYDAMIAQGMTHEEAAEEILRLIGGSVKKAQGGRIGFKKGSVNKPGTHSWYLMQLNKPRRGAQEGGLMDLGGMEKDYRQEGGFVPIGGREKADDVPARLSKNEFVFTADAVRNAGGGDIDAGAEVMENLMEHLEAGGKVSEDSQGLEGAQEMFANTQRLQNRII
jgi:hypothetical protein